jgi:hypothetical protein
MTRSNLRTWLAVCAITLAGLLAAEGMATIYNRHHGKNMPFLFMRGESAPEGEVLRMTAIDPHLGSAHVYADEGGISIPHTLLPGFVAFIPPEVKEWPRPWIVALGGSTTDPLLGNGSWPGALARLMQRQHIKGTVINGGVGAYTTSQELIKLVRDVVELKPDIVISYSGINEQGKWGQLPYPMVHTRQRDLFNQMFSQTRKPPPIFTNTVFLLMHLGQEKRQTDVAIEYGIPTKKSSGEFWMRNVELMHAIAEAEKIRYVSIIQPVIGVSGTEPEPRHVHKMVGSYRQDLRQSYVLAQAAAKTRPYLEDFSGLLANRTDVFFDDARHISEEGNEIVSRRMLDMLKKRHWLQE